MIKILEPTENYLIKINIYFFLIYTLKYFIKINLSPLIN
jgi:hypothetical protein